MGLGCQDFGEAFGGRGIAAAVAADISVDNDHGDAGQVSELDGFEDIFPGSVLGAIDEGKIGGASVFDDAAIQRTHSGGISASEAKGGFCVDVS